VQPVRGGKAVTACEVDLHAIGDLVIGDLVVLAPSRNR
jgi:hypothetical protein